MQCALSTAIVILNVKCLIADYTLFREKLISIEAIVDTGSTPET